MTIPTGLILPPPLPVESFIETTLYPSGSAAWPSANLAIGVLLPKRRSPLTLTRLGVLMFSASGNIDLGVYTWDGAQFVRVASSGSTAASGSNAMQYITLGSPPVYDGRTDLWLWCAADNGTLSMGRAPSIAAVTAIGNRVAAKASSFPLPSTIASPTTQATIPYIYGGA